MAFKYKNLSPKKIGTLVVLLLFVIFLIFSLVGEEEEKVVAEPVKKEIVDSIIQHSRYVDSVMLQPRKEIQVPEKRRGRYGFRFRRGIDYRLGFPDLNDVQLATAQKLGIPVIADREEAIKRKDELVYVGESPYYDIDQLNYSIPYLIPRAARLLNEISRSFIDSLATRGIPFYKPLVTSLLRTEKDVKRLRRVNCNASANSCHCYGTTFDIAYSKFIPVCDPDAEKQTTVWPAELKQILAEVIDDQRKKGTCYVRYEFHQSCFHITAR